MNRRTYSGQSQALARDSRQPASLRQSELLKKAKLKWRFRPKWYNVLLSWGFLAFLLCKILLIPLSDGLVKYIAAGRELGELNVKNQLLEKELEAMAKERDHMLTLSYIEKRGHQIGMLKENERQMVVVDAAEDEDLRKLLARRKKRVEIGD